MLRLTAASLTLPVATLAGRPTTAGRRPLLTTGTVAALAGSTLAATRSGRPPATAAPRRRLALAASIPPAPTAATSAVARATAGPAPGALALAARAGGATGGT